MSARLDKVVKSRWAADYADLPKLNRLWTQRGVRSLPDSRPDWLTEARRRHAATRQQISEARAAELEVALTRLGYDADGEDAW
ncbi:hypothetical protein [Micromonospora ureilytica]|uniref:hypothetical protein n=1 Tax=Micromonospora ureilytica TaxID=709868 RepID=UPI000F5FE70C|nr:hypothetical protein [Micromonospora ureilytica]